MKIFKLAIASAIGATLLFTSCNEEENALPAPNSTSAPTTFSVDIPSSISRDASSSRVASTTGARAFRSDSVFDVSWIYDGLPHFIRIGEQSAEIVESISQGISKFNLAQVQAFDYTADDGKLKALEVKEEVSANGETWHYGLQIKDKTDDAVAMQIFWNSGEGNVKGLAIMNPYLMDKRNKVSIKDAMYKIEYSEVESNYDAVMDVSISGLSQEKSTDTFWVETIRMTARKTGDIVEVFGNSHHPDFEFNNGSKGKVARNYAFRAKGHDINNYGVAEVALPPSTTTSSDVYTNFNIKKVVESEYTSAAGGLIFNETAPGYFADDKFLGDGETTQDSTKFTDDFVKLSDMTSFIPSEIKTLAVTFESF